MTMTKVCYDFTDSRIIVTGSTKGIGKEIAYQLMASGAKVGVTGRDENALSLIQSEADERGWTCDTFPADLSNSESIGPLVHHFASVFGGIDGLVNNAGINICEPLGELSVNSVKQVMEVNLIAPMLLTNAVVPYMKQGGGRIVTVASLSSVTAFQEHSAYCASKQGLLGYVKVAAMELGRYGITVNAVGPTVVLTELGKEAWGIDPVKRRKMEQMIPMGRFLETTDVAPTVLFLLSDGAAMISGEFILIDGGYMTGKGI
jgi:2-deoxy-D-gluconate 3-dehydrogenase